MTEELEAELAELLEEKQTLEDFFQKARGRINASVGHMAGQRLTQVKEQITEIENELKTLRTK